MGNVKLSEDIYKIVEGKLILDFSASGSKSALTLKRKKSCFFSKLNQHFITLGWVEAAQNMFCMPHPSYASVPSVIV